MTLLGVSISGLSAAWIAAATAGGAVVLALHLRSWKRSRAVLHPGAAVMASHETRSDAPSARSLARWLLACVRALALALGLLAFGTPTWSDDGAASAGGRRVIVVDVSASMGVPARGVTRLDLALDGARRSIGRTDPASSPTALLFAGERVREALPGFARNRASLLGVLGKAEPADEAFDAGGAIARARGLLGEAGGRIDVFTDGQHALPNAPGVRVHVVDIGAMPANAGIVGLSWSPARPVAGDTVRVTCDVVRAGGAGAGARVRVRFGGREREVWAPAGERASVTAAFGVEETGRFEVEAAVEPDAFAPDDAARATIDVPERLRVFSFGDVGPMGVALAPGAGAERYESREGSSANDAVDADLVLVDAGTPIGAAVLDALRVAHDAGVPIVWIVRTPSGADLFARWCDEAGIPAPAFAPAPAPDGRVTLRSGDGGVLDAASAYLDLVDVRARAGVSVAGVIDGWRAGLRDASGGVRAIVRGGVGVLVFDPSAREFASSPAAPLLAHELAGTLLDAGGPSRSVESFPAEELAPLRSAPSASASADEASVGSVAEELPLAPWLALGALLLLLVEPFVRARSPGGRA
ncbi:MAG: VWA domain-containing protein [Planctomycetota bacterium]